MRRGSICNLADRRGGRQDLRFRSIGVVSSSTRGRVATNRYFGGSPVYPGRLSHDWNRSAVLEPDGEPRGAVVFARMTDSLQRALVMSAIASTASWRSPSGFPPTAPFRALITSTGGLDGGHNSPSGGATTDRSSRPARRQLFQRRRARAVRARRSEDGHWRPGPHRAALVIGVAVRPVRGLAALPQSSGVWRRRGSTWCPEFNPFKYNSFPVNAAVSAHRDSTPCSDRSFVWIASSACRRSHPSSPSSPSSTSRSARLRSSRRSMLIFRPTGASWCCSTSIGRSSSARCCARRPTRRCSASCLRCRNGIGSP